MDSGAAGLVLAASVDGRDHAARSVGSAVVRAAASSATLTGELADPGALEPASGVGQEPVRVAPVPRDAAGELEPARCALFHGAMMAARRTRILRLRAQM